MGIESAALLILSMNIKLLPSNSGPSAICRDVPTVRVSVPVRVRLYDQIKGFHTLIQQRRICF
jgi:hypothetical protein